MPTESHPPPTGPNRGGYCAATPAQLTGVTAFEDLLDRLEASCVLVLQGALAHADPVVELSRLVAILGGAPTGEGPLAATPVAAGSSGLTLARVSTAAVLALLGADGDPEVEWEDVTALWCRSTGLPEYRLDEELLMLIEHLRGLVTVAQAGTSLYCWGTELDGAAVTTPTRTVDTKVIGR